MKKIILIILLLIVMVFSLLKIINLPKIDVVKYQRINQNRTKQEDQYDLYSVISQLQDSLYVLISKHERPNFSTLIYSTTDIRNPATIASWQLNLPLAYNYKLHQLKNSYDEILFPDVKINDLHIIHDCPINLITTPERKFIVEFMSALESKQYVAYLANLNNLINPNSKVDIITFLSKDDKYYFIMNVEQEETSEIWLVPIVSIKNTRELLYSDESAKPYQIGTLSGEIDDYKVRLISLEDNKILVLPTKQSGKSLISVLELKSFHIKTLDTVKNLDNPIYVLGSSNDDKNLLFARKESTETCSLIGIDSNLEQHLITSNINISFDDIKIDKRNENLIYVYQGSINKYNLTSRQVVNQQRFSGMNRIHGPFLRNGDELFVLSAFLGNQIAIIDAELQGSKIFTMPSEPIKIYDIKFFQDKVNRSTQVMILHGASKEFSLISKIEFVVFPDNKVSNLLNRFTNRTRILTASIYEFAKKNITLSIILIVLMIISITFSFFASRKLLKERYENIISFVPIPLNFKLMKRLKKYTVKPSLVHVAILNVDIVNFSQIVIKNSESPATLQQIVDNFFKLFIEEAFNRGGTIGKIMGDGIVAIFGWPKLEGIKQTTINENYHNALETALAMQKKELSIEGIEVVIRQGITMGDIYLGHFGNKHRKDYLAIGEAINYSEVIQKNAPEGEIQMSLEVAECLGLTLHIKKNIFHNDDVIVVGTYRREDCEI